MKKVSIVSRTLFALVVAALLHQRAVGEDIGYLDETSLIDLSNSALQETTDLLIEGKSTAREQALAIHRFVRDEVSFGFTGSFYSMRASDVLKVRKGFCLTKSTLFIAMLRLAGIPARQHFVDITSDILDGIADPPTNYLDHSYTEVYLNGTWLKVDSYTVDKQLFEKSQKLLAQEDLLLGYGVHTHGTIEWDGRTDSFVQLVKDGSAPDISSKDYGIFEDVEAFYKLAEEPRNKQGLFMSLVFPFLVNSINGNIERIRWNDD